MRRFAVVSGFPLSFGTTQNTSRLNVARAVLSAPSVSWQTPVPEQPPLHSPKVEPTAAVAVSVTTVPSASDAEQVVPHSMPAGELVTVPDPEPPRVTESVCTVCANVAVTVWSAPSVTTQGFVPEQAPLQPVNVEPAAGVAVSVTTVPSASAAEQVAPQAIAAGELVTVPLPAPAGLTVNVCMISVNVAVAVWSAPRVTTHVPVPEQPPPLQPVQVEPAAAVAVRVTAVPS